MNLWNATQRDRFKHIHQRRQIKRANKFMVECIILLSKKLQFPGNNTI